MTTTTIRGTIQGEISDKQRLSIPKPKTPLRDDEIFDQYSLAEKYERDVRWVNNMFIRPIDHQTGARLLTADGSPMPGVKHKKLGSLYIIPVISIKEWIMETGTQIRD